MIVNEKSILTQILPYQNLNAKKGLAYITTLNLNSKPVQQCITGTGSRSARCTKKCSTCRRDMVGRHPLHCWNPTVLTWNPEFMLFPSLKSGFSAHIHYHPPRSCGQMASFAAAAADTRPGGVKPEVAITGNLFVSSSFLLRGTCDLERTQVAASPKSC